MVLCFLFRCVVCSLLSVEMQQTLVYLSCVLKPCRAQPRLCFVAFPRRPSGHPQTEMAWFPPFRSACLCVCLCLPRCAHHWDRGDESGGPSLRAASPALHLESWQEGFVDVLSQIKEVSL